MMKIKQLRRSLAGHRRDVHRTWTDDEALAEHVRTLVAPFAFDLSMYTTLLHGIMGNVDEQKPADLATAKRVASELWEVWARVHGPTAMRMARPNEPSGIGRAAVQLSAQDVSVARAMVVADYEDAQRAVLAGRRGSGLDGSGA